MILAPKLPPGRSNRKALAFHAEIVRLRSLGYSFEAIRQALLDVGVKVSRSTVRREAVAKRGCDKNVPNGTAYPTAFAEAVANPVPSPRHARQGAALLTRAYTADRRTAKEIAEDFMKSRNTNPLLQERSLK